MLRCSWPSACWMSWSATSRSAKSTAAPWRVPVPVRPLPAQHLLRAPAQHRPDVLVAEMLPGLGLADRAKQRLALDERSPPAIHFSTRPSTESGSQTNRCLSPLPWLITNLPRISPETRCRGRPGPYYRNLRRILILSDSTATYKGDATRKVTMKGTFNADYAMTVATVIPVLYLALTIQGTTFENILTRWKQAAEKEHRLKNEIRLALPALTAFYSFTILLSSLVSEYGAIRALYYRQAYAQFMPLLSIAGLLVLIAAGPIIRFYTILWAANPEKKDSRQPSGLGWPARPPFS